MTIERSEPRARSRARSRCTTIDRALVEAAAQLRADGEPFLVATVVAVHGSAYRQPGARMVIARERWVAGSVSGGCLESDVIRKGWWRTEGGEPALVRYDSRVADDADRDELREAFAVGCNGVIEILIERAGAAAARAGNAAIDPLAFAARCLADQQRAAIAVVYRAAERALVGARLCRREDGDGDGALEADAALAGTPARAAIDRALAAALATGESCDLHAPGGVDCDVFVEALAPPPQLFVFGTGPDAEPVVAIARTLGWDVRVCAPALRPAAALRFAGEHVCIGSPRELVDELDRAARPLAIVMAHDLELDRAHLGALVGSRARYIGVLGPRRRTDRMLADLGVAADARLHAPVGLELGAETPQEIALAIVAEVQAELAEASAHSLRERTGPIHARARVA